jgi:hypothetical protein
MYGVGGGGGGCNYVTLVLIFGNVGQLLQKLKCGTQSTLGPI